MSRRPHFGFLSALAPLAFATACASSPAPPPPLPPPPTPLPALPDDAPLASSPPNARPTDAPSAFSPHAAATGDRELAALNLGFQGCRVMGLRLDPSMRGRALLTARLAPSGQVLDVEATHVESLPRIVVTCLLARVQHTRFDARGGYGSDLVIPVDFTDVTHAPSARPAPAPPGVHNL